MNVTLSVEKYNLWEWIGEEKIKFKKEKKINEEIIFK